MDFTQALSVLRLSWDLPWRVAASVAILATVIGAIFGRSALESFAEIARWLGATREVSSALVTSHDWLVARDSLFGPMGLALLLIALVFAGASSRYRGSSRAPATALLGAALAAESGWGQGAIWIAILVFGLWILSLVLRVIVVAKNQGIYPGDNGAFWTEQRLRQTWLATVIAAVYIPVAPLTWAIAR